MRRIRTILMAAVVAVAAAAALSTPVFAQWPTTCVDLNDIVENHLGRTNNVGIYQRVFGDQAEAACQNDHREDVRGVFAWAFDLEPARSAASRPPAVPASSLPLVHDSLTSAVFSGDTDQVRALVASGLNVNARTKDGRSLLDYALRWQDSGDTEIVQILVDAGANVNVTDAGGEPPIFDAVFSHRADIVQVLVDAGADVDAKDADGKPLLHDAVFWADVDTEIVQILVDAGANVNATNAGGEPPIFDAIFYNRVDVVQIFVDAGANLNATDAKGRTPLGDAVFWNHHEIVEILLAAPAVEAELGWPTTCVDLNDIVENHLGNDHNVGIYQKVFGDQAEAGCQNDHREDVRGVFAWAF